MPVRKLSIALEDETAAAAAAAAERRGVSLSSWLNEAAENALHIEAGLRAVAEWEAKHGAITSEELAEANRFLARKPRRRAS
jgi:Mg-chelatase subunit ChlD